MLKILSLFSTDISEQAVAFDKKTVKIITIIGIPSAFLLHGYVGFIFGSVKANPWWSSVMMPVVFLFSAIVSGIAIVMLLYMIIVPLRGGKIDMKCSTRWPPFCSMPSSSTFPSRCSISSTAFTKARSRSRSCPSW